MFLANFYFFCSEKLCWADFFSNCFKSDGTSPVVFKWPTRAAGLVAMLHIADHMSTPSLQQVTSQPLFCSMEFVLNLFGPLTSHSKKRINQTMVLKHEWNEFTHHDPIFKNITARGSCCCVRARCTFQNTCQLFKTNFTNTLKSVVTMCCLFEKRCGNYKRGKRWWKERRRNGKEQMFDPSYLL